MIFLWRIFYYLYISFSWDNSNIFPAFRWSRLFEVNNISNIYMFMCNFHAFNCLCTTWFLVIFWIKYTSIFFHIRHKTPMLFFYNLIPSCIRLEPFRDSLNNNFQIWTSGTSQTVIVLNVIKTQTNYKLNDAEKMKWTGSLGFRSLVILVFTVRPLSIRNNKHWKGD
jgi:hypothetical protein